MTEKTQKFRSKWWYVLPIFLNLIGGIISWIAIKKDDRNLAKNCLLLGILLNIVWTVLFGWILFTFENLSFSSDLGTNFEESFFDLKFNIVNP